jgi:hypothetical protein
MVKKNAGLGILERDDSEVLKDYAVRTAVFRYLRDYCHPTPEKLVKEAAEQTNLDPMYVCKVINEMIVGRMLELHLYRAQDGWHPVLDRIHGCT